MIDYNEWVTEKTQDNATRRLARLAESNDARLPRWQRDAARSAVVRHEARILVLAKLTIALASAPPTFASPPSKETTP